MRSNYNYEDLDDEVVHDLEKADMYWEGSRRRQARGGRRTANALGRRVHRRGNRCDLLDHGGCMVKACKVCGASVPNHRTFCSQACHSKSQIKVPDMALTLKLVDAGEKAGQMAAQLGVCVPVLRQFLRTQGLHRRWTSNRYLKCREVA
jgi:hypothetical protein